MPFLYHGPRWCKNGRRMKKIVVHKAGGYDRLTLESHPDPVPGRGEVLVATEAIGVNYADCIVRMGLYASAKKYVGWPITPGFELAGTVAAVGDGVDGWAVGRRVFGITRFGGYATHVVVPAHQIYPVPDGFTMNDAAGFPAVFMTAYYALCELVHPRPGSRMLVHSAAGGVGGALVQLGAILGCETVGVVGASHKKDAARRFGAAHVVDKSSEDLWPTIDRLVPGGFDVVLDANGVSTLAKSYQHVRPTGKLVVYGFHSMIPRRGGRPDYFKLARDYLRTPRFSPLAMTNDNKSVLAFNLSYLFEEQTVLREGMARLLGWIADGRIAPPPTTTFALDRVADAHRAIESGNTVGKLILVP
jgi:NADPH:quinone reductase-like Zn-dependent oxidoreductase